jgi:hypothetical protein
MIITSLISAVLMWLYTSTGESFAIPLLILLGFFMFASTPILLAVVNDIDSEHAAFLNGVFMTINFLFSAFAIILVGVFGDLMGLELTYRLSPLFGLLSIPFIIGLGETT